MMLMLPGSLDSDWLTWFSTWLDMKDILFIADLGLLNEDDFLAMLFLFHRGVTRTLAGFGEDGVLVGVDGDDGVLPPLVDGEDDDEEDGRGGRHHSDPIAPRPAGPCPSSWA